MTRQRFTPEFLNRLDDIVIFSPLTVNALHRILSQLMETVRLPAVACLRWPTCGYADRGRGLRAVQFSFIL
jgi:hypothetical protein